MEWCLRNYKLYMNVEKTTVFQRQNNVVLSTLNQRRNLTLKKSWIWVDTKAVLFLCFDVWESIKCILTLKRQLYFKVVKTSFCRNWTNVNIQYWSNIEFGFTLKAVLFLCYDAWEITNYKWTLERKSYFNFETTSSWYITGKLKLKTIKNSLSNNGPAKQSRLL